MSGVEELIKPTLIPMLQGQSIDLARDEQQKLSTWITMKTLVMENEVPADKVIQSDGLASFKSNRTIP
jgi:hypothetical protein